MLDKSRLQGEVSPSKTDPDEIRRFDTMAEQWWDPHGKFKTALAFNEARLAVIEGQLKTHFSGIDDVDKPFTGLSVLDVGSGGGLISEPLAARGAEVLGIDASAVSVQVARRHALSQGIDVNYQHCLLEDLPPEQFDVVINAEVVEHVPDQASLIAQCAQRVKPGGLLILATLNRTPKSYLVAILGAEYLLRYLPIGTHRWDWFVKPQELRDWLPKNAFTPLVETGMSLNPLTGRWRTTRSMAVNYLMCFARTGAP